MYKGQNFYRVLFFSLNIRYMVDLLSFKVVYSLFVVRWSRNLLYNLSISLLDLHTHFVLDIEKCGRVLDNLKSPTPSWDFRRPLLDPKLVLISSGMPALKHALKTQELLFVHGLSITLNTIWWCTLSCLLKTYLRNLYFLLFCIKTDTDTLKTIPLMFHLSAL